jgi:predicted transcriptional regulator
VPKAVPKKPVVPKPALPEVPNAEQSVHDTYESNRDDSALVKQLKSNRESFVNVSEQKKIKMVQDLYRDSSFPAAGSRVLNIHKCLLLEFGINISVNTIRKAVFAIPTYVMHLKVAKGFERSHYTNITSYSEYVQASISSHPFTKIYHALTRPVISLG